MTLKTKYTFVLVAILALAIGSLSLNSWTQFRYALTQLEQRVAELATETEADHASDIGRHLIGVLAEALADPVKNDKTDRITSLMDEAARGSDVGQIALLDLDGKIILSRSRDDMKIDPVVSMSLIGDLLNGDGARLIRAGTQVQVLLPVKGDQNQPLAVLSLLVSPRDDASAIGDGLHNTQIALSQSFVISLLIAVGIFLILGTIVAVWVARELANPILDLAERTAEIGRGNYEASSPSARRDELGTLANAIADMAADLRGKSVSRGYLSSLVDNLPEPLMVLNRAGHVLRVNRAACILCGLAESELIGKPLSELFRVADGGTGLLEAMKRGVDEGFIRTGEGELRPVLLSVSQLAPQSGGEHYMLAIRDIAERKAAEQATAQARDAAISSNRAKGQFLANMSHELRTPLNAIIGYADLTKMKLKAEDEDREKLIQYASSIADSGYHLLEIINGILDMSKIEAGAMELSEETYVLGDLIRAAMRFLEPKAAEQQLTLEDVTAAEMLETRLWVDGRLLRQMLGNLLSNAVKFTPPQGKVSVRARRTGDGGLAIAIRDTGIGMTKDEAIRARGLFEQIQSELAREHDGTGLGLALVENMAALHQGRFDLYSRKGRGTSAVIRLGPERIVHERPDKPLEAAQ